MPLPTEWLNLKAFPAHRSTEVMVSYARNLGSQSLSAGVFVGVYQALIHNHFSVNSVGISGVPVQYIEMFGTAAGTERALRHRYHHEAYSTEDLYHSEAVFWTRRQRRQFARDWSNHSAVILGRATSYIGMVRRLIGQVVGDLPVHDAEGNELTGQAAFDRRVEIFNGPLCEEWQRFSNLNAMREWLENATSHDWQPDALSSDLSIAKEQLLERIDDAARDRLAFLLDCEDPAYARPIGSQQATAFNLLEQRRQNGRRSVRGAGTVADANTRAQAAIGLIENVLTEDAPVWRSSSGGALTLVSGRFQPTWTPPGSGTYSITLQVRRVTERANATDEIALEAPGIPAGWTAGIGAKQGTGAAAYWPVTVTVGDWSAPNLYDFELIARDAIGPARLPVRVVVPASAD